MPKFAERLTKARDLRGLSQELLAKRAGLHESHVSHFEHGDRLPSYQNLLKLADTLKVSVDYLMGRTDESAYFDVGNQLLHALGRLSLRDYQVVTTLIDVLAKIDRLTNTGRTSLDAARQAGVLEGDC
jgi:transcriptional regulator with XRE-family HTH domain